MANITRRQIESRINVLTKKLEDIYEQINDLKDAIEEEADSIEPYDFKYELTPAQEERKEWLEDCVYQLDEVLEYIDSATSSLEDM